MKQGLGTEIPRASLSDVQTLNSRFACQGLGKTQEQFSRPTPSRNMLWWLLIGVELLFQTMFSIFQPYQFQFSPSCGNLSCGHAGPCFSLPPSCLTPQYRTLWAAQGIREEQGTGTGVGRDTGGASGP